MFIYNAFTKISEIKKCLKWKIPLKDPPFPIMFYACKNGNLDVVLFLIAHGFNNWDSGLQGACIGGHEHIAKLMLRKITMFFSDMSLVYACRGGNVNVINLMIESLTYENCIQVENWNYCLYNACASGNIDAVKIIIEKGSGTQFLWSNAFVHACRSGNMKMVQFIIEKGIAPFDELDTAILQSCYHGNMEIINLLLEIHKNKPNILIKWNLVLGFACQYNHMDILKLAIEHNANDWNNGFVDACFGGHMNMVKLMFVKANESGTNLSWERALSSACSRGSISIVKFIMSNHQFNEDELEHSLRYPVIQKGHLNIAKFLIQNGANFDRNETPLIKILYTYYFNYIMDNVISRKKLFLFKNNLNNDLLRNIMKYF